MDNTSTPSETTPSLNRRILALALPALGTLIAEPLLLAADSTMVGHLGTAPLAGLAAGSTLLAFIVGLCVFLAYTTTALTSRKIGEGDRCGALTTGIQGLWLALALGIIIAGILYVSTPWILSLIGTRGDALTHAISYTRASAPGIVGMLIVLAGNGIMRGLLDTKTPLVISTLGSLANIPLSFVLIYPLDLGVAGAGIGTALAQTAMGLGFCAVVVSHARREGVSLAPAPALIARSGLQGAPLVVRTLSLQLTLVLSVSAAAKLGELTLAGHQILKTLWNISAYGMDALAIAAQAFVGQALGEGDRDAVRQLVTRLTRWGAACGLILGILIAATSPFLPTLFGASGDVARASTWGLLAVAGCQVIAGVVYMYDGILIGANDSRYLAIAQVIVLAIYAPVILLVPAVSPGGTTGLVTVWLAYGVVCFGVRWATLAWRIRTDTWMRAS